MAPIGIYLLISQWCLCIFYFFVLHVHTFYNCKNALILKFDGGFCELDLTNWHFWKVKIENAQYFKKQSGKTKTGINGNLK